MGKKELKVAFLLSLRSLQRGNRSSTVMTVLIIALCFTNMIFLPGLFNGIGQSITKQLVDYEVGNVLVSPHAGDQYITDLSATLDLINRMPGVERATPHYTKGATLKYPAFASLRHVRCNTTNISLIFFAHRDNML
jgi:putative ABC transport system permease protein